MNWFPRALLPSGTSSSSSSSSSQSTAVPHAQRQRRKQIDSLREQVNGVVEEIRDLRYSVHFQAGGIDFHLTINLPLGFPKDAPVVTVSPLGVHPWINAEGRVVGCPALKNYSLHENMGKVIKQIVDELTSSPPQLFPLQNSVPSGTPYPSLGDVHIGFPPTTVPASSTVNPLLEPRRPPPPPPPYQGKKKYHAPPVPDSFPELQNKSNEELQELLKEEGFVAVKQIVENHPVMEKIRVDREALVTENENQAEINLRHEPELQEGYEQLQRKYAELEDLKSRFNRSYAKQNEIMLRYAPHITVAKLDQLSAEAEASAEKYGEAFVEGQMQVAEFVRSFKQQQKLHYIRQAKASLLDDTTKRTSPKPWSPN